MTETPAHTDIDPAALLPGFGAMGIFEAVQCIRETVIVVREGRTGRLGIAVGGGTDDHGRGGPEMAGGDVVGLLPPLYPERLGDRGFTESHRVRFPYVIGEMANGLTSTRMVIEGARAGFLGFMGAAGLDPGGIESAVAQLADELGPDGPWGSNLIHSPHEPDLEEATVAVYLKRGVRRVSASAFTAMTPPLVRYVATGLAVDARGRIRRPNRLFAKVSRPETAKAFLSPAPPAILEALVSAGRLSREEAGLAGRIPLAEDVTVEADSGGHTDNRPLTAIFPSIAAARDELAARHGYTRPISLGAAGGLGTPEAVAAAFALGAAYVMTGSVNQSAVESGLGAWGRRLLSEAGLADMMMAPSADMFEQGARVQVLKRGTLFGPRARRLQEVYRTHGSLEEIPEPVRRQLEEEIFRRTLASIWEETEAFWNRRDPRQAERAGRDPKHRMALVFRWYLGLASHWAIEDDTGRRQDFQIWCGPAMGAFNDWVRGSFLEDPDARTVAQIGLNLLEGACVAARAQTLRSCGVPVPPSAFRFRPRFLSPGTAPT